MKQTSEEFEWPRQSSRLPARPITTILILGAAFGASVFVTRWLGRANERNYIGHIAAHTKSITAESDGKIEKILTMEGTWVEPGHELFTIMSKDGEPQREAQRQIVNQLQAELDQSRAQAELEMKWRIKTIDAEIYETRLQAATILKEKYDYEVEDLAWSDFIDEVNSMSRRGQRDQLVSYLSQKTLSNSEQQTKAKLAQASARNASEVSAAQVEMCDTRLQQLEKLRQELPANVAEAAGIAVAEAKLEAAESELNRLEASITTTTQKSPAFGTVGLYVKSMGDQVSRGEPVVRLLDGDRRYVSVAVPSREVWRFNEGAEVKLIFPDGQKRTGTIAPIPPQTVSSDTLNSGESLVMLRIDPAGKLWPTVVIGTEITVQLN